MGMSFQPVMQLTAQSRTTMSIAEVAQQWSKGLNRAKCEVCVGATGMECVCGRMFKWRALAEDALTEEARVLGWVKVGRMAGSEHLEFGAQE